MGRFDLLLLDADDTIFDFPACEMAALQATCAVFGLPCDDTVCATYAKINRELWDAFERNETTQPELRRERFVRLLDYLDAEGDVELISKCYTDALGQCAIFLPGAEDVVQAAAQIVPIVIVTNGIASVQRSRIGLTRLPEWVKGMVISGEVGVAKPDPRMAQVALEMGGCTDPSRALLVGDSLRADIGCARAAGVTSCWYNPNHLKNETANVPDMEIHDLGELLQLLANS